MNQELIQTWNTILSVVETQVPRGNFLTLFKNTALLTYEDSIATIAVPNAMIIDLIQKRYLPLLKGLVQKELGEETDIIFVVKTVQEEKPIQDTPLFSEETQPIQKFIGHLPRVRPDYTFQNVAVSSSNQLAFIAAQTVAQNIGSSYNPLFIYGPTGVGKTHLMQAIANEAYMKDPSKKIIYITSEEFTNEVVEAIRTNQTHTMKKRFRSAYVLLIDDVQFIAGKDRVQEELFHTFNTLIDGGAQIVLSSDRPPSEIKKLETRLSSRFSGGLTVDIEPPDFELKTAILLIKAKKFNIDLPIEAAKIIADSVMDTRSLEGALLRVITKASTTGKLLSEELARNVIEARPEIGKRKRHPDDLIETVCEYFAIKTTQLKGPKRDSHLVKARQAAMYLLKKELGLTYVEIGNVLGGRDHTTIMYGVEKVEKQVGQKDPLGEDIVGITKLLSE